MSIKLTLVENHINRNFKQYNIDDFTIKENTFMILGLRYTIIDSKVNINKVVIPTWLNISLLRRYSGYKVTPKITI